MDRRLSYAIFFAGGLAIGYKVAEKHVTDKYVQWHKTHRYSCWTANDDIQRPGDYPQVFVVEKIVYKEN